MPAAFNSRVRFLTRAVDATSIEVKEFHEDFGSYSVYEYTQYNEKGKAQRVTEKLPLGIFEATEAKQIWERFCVAGFGEVVP